MLYGGLHKRLCSHGDREPREKRVGGELLGLAMRHQTAGTVPGRWPVPASCSARGSELEPPGPDQGPEQRLPEAPLLRQGDRQLWLVPVPGGSHPERSLCPLGIFHFKRS